jgi:DNA-binding response OmpR family regulator
MPEPGGPPDADADESGGSGRRADADAEDNGDTGTQRNDSDTGTHRNDSDTGTHRNDSDTGTHRNDSDTGTHRNVATSSASDGSGGPETVLVVEDEESLAALYREWLTGTYDVHVANTGREALDQLEAAVDVVLLDRRLPRISGQEVLDQVRASDEDYQVAMVTAVEPDVDVLEMGFDDYVSKPIARDDLRSLVASLVVRNQYSGCVQRYFRLLSKRATLEREFDGDLAEYSEYGNLCREITAIEAELGDLVETFSVDDFEAEFYQFHGKTAAADD